MSERVTTWGDLLGRRSDHRFVGRRHEIEQFRLNFLYSVPPALLFVLHGPGGIGKSALVAEYAAIAREHGFVVAAVDGSGIRVPGEAAVLQVMSVLAQQLATAGVPLTSFDEVLREYTAALKAMAPDPQRPDVPRAPGYPWDLFGGVGDDDAWATRAWDEYLLHTVSLRRSPLIRDPIRALTERFVQDLNAWATVRRILICIDDYQRFVAEGAGRSELVEMGARATVENGPDAWLFDLLARGQLSTNIWLVIAGRDPLPRSWESLATVRTEFALRPLSRRDSRVLLHHLGGADEAAITAQGDSARVDPLSLTILASLAGPRQRLSEQLRLQEVSPAEGAVLVERYVASLDPVLRAAVLKCAAARWLDEGVISALVGDQAVPRVLQWLEDSPLAVGTASAVGSRLGIHGQQGWRFRSALRPQLDALARQAGGVTWEAAHQTLYAYYRQQLELRGPEPQYLDPAWQHCQLEALYHNFMAGDEAEARDAALLSFLRGVRQFHPWAGAVVQVCPRTPVHTWAVGTARRQNAGHEPDSSTSHWAEVVGGGWAALAHRDWETALAFADLLLSEDVAAASALWGPETRQALRTLRQLIAGRLALPPEVDGTHHLDAVQEQLEMEPDEPDSAPDIAEVSLACELGADVDDQSMPDSADNELVAVQEETPPPGSAPSAEAMAEEHCGYANQLLGEGAYTAAIEGYDQALALDPDNVAAVYNRGLAYSQIGALGNALADFSRVIELASSDTDVDRRMQAHHQRGLICVRQGALDRAIADFDVVIENAKAVPTAQVRPRTPVPTAEAIPTAVAVPTAEAVPMAVIYERANAYFRLQSYQRAIEDYSWVLKQNPSHVEAYLNRGRSHAARADYLDALRDYNQAIALGPSRAIAYSYRGQAYLRLERYPEALADYARALELNPRDASVHNARGLLYVRIAAYPEAVDAYQHAMAIQPDWATPYYNAACAAALANDAERATIWLARAIALRDGYKAMALRDKDFASIREDPRFAELVEIDGT